MSQSAAAKLEARPPSSAREMIDAEDFKLLVKRRWTVSATLLVALFVTYFGFILLVAADRELMSQRIGEYTTLAIPVGVGVIVISFLLTAVYVAWANRSYDPEVQRLRNQLRQ